MKSDSKSMSLKEKIKSGSSLKQVSITFGSIPDLTIFTVVLFSCPDKYLMKYTKSIKLVTSAITIRIVLYDHQCR